MSGESELLAALELGGSGGRVLLGPGDDGAVVRLGGGEVVTATDALVDGVHVDLGLSSLEDFGWKALAVNCSDLAAMAARPVAALVCLQRPDWLSTSQARRLQAGLDEAAEHFGCPVVGGDIVGAPTLSLAVSVLGEPAVDGFWLRRGGAADGDVVLVVGPLGLAAAGLALWRAGAVELLEAHGRLAAAHRRPDAQTAAALPLAEAPASAGIDVSDGLGRDLGRLAAASGVAVELDPARLPVDADVEAAAEHLGLDRLDLVVGGGDDYALAVTVPPDRAPGLRDGLDAAGLGAWVVGEVAAGSGVRLDGRDVSTLGWEHTALGEEASDG